jgi:hypothetical protein
VSVCVAEAHERVPTIGHESSTPSTLLVFARESFGDRERPLVPLGRCAEAHSTSTGWDANGWRARAASTPTAAW